MMVFSIGTDIVDIFRIDRLITRYGERFGKRVLSLEELADWHISKCSPAFLAKRFAAKEAVAKALGTGIGSGVGFQNIIIRHEVNGAPAASLTGGAAKAMRNFGASRVLLSISDERSYAIAFAVLSN